MPINYDASFIDTMPKNVAVQFLERVNKSGPREAFRFPVGENWESVTWNQVGDRASALAAGLMSLGIEPEQRVGIASTTRYEWNLARSEERRVGKEWGSTGRSRGSPDHQKKKKKKQI